MVELLKQVPPLLSERPEDILRFFVRLGQIHVLGLVEDRIFITRILPLVSGGLLQFWGACLRDRNSWAICKSRILEEYFPRFIRERLIRDLILFNFHENRQPMRLYRDQVFQAAEFLHYEATEHQLVERVIMNLHPDILNQAAFLDKPRSRKELGRVVGLIEEKFSILSERERLAQVKSRGNDSRGPPSNSQRRTRTPVKGPVKCWDCGQMGHVRSSCSRR